MKKKKIVIALGHDALGTTLPEQKKATKKTAKAVADFIKDDYQIAGRHDPHGNVRVLPSLSGVHSNSDECLLRNEPGIYRLRLTERDPHGAFEPWDLQAGCDSADPGVCRSL